MRLCFIRLVLAWLTMVPLLARAAEVPLVIQITSPTNQQFFAASPAQVPIEVYGIDPEGRIIRVDYFNGDKKIGESTNAPFSIVWENASPGTNQLRALAWDDGGVTNVSGIVEVVVNYPPLIELSYPRAGETICLGSNVVIDAAITDPDGTVVSVVCGVNGTQVAEFTNPPYSLVLSNLPLGESLLTVVATDNWGVETTLQVPFAMIVPDAGLLETFEPGLHAENWSGYGGILGVDLVATNYAGSVSGSNAMWFNADDDRFLVTRSMSLRPGAALRFSLRIAGGTEDWWNEATLPDEGIVLDYSNNGGDWVILGRYNTVDFTNWQQVILRLPPEALGTNILLRWYQEQHTGAGFDQWALDDIQIVVSSNGPTILTPPQNVITVAGASAVYSVVASGFPPLFYQWNANGTIYPPSTNAAFIWESVSTNMSGWYVSVVVSNYAGSVTSPPASLMVSRGESDLFAIAAFGTNNATVVEQESLTGDDRGGMAVSSNLVWLTGDGCTVRFNAANLGNATRYTRVYDGLCANLRTEQVYTFAQGTNAYSSGGVIDGLLAFDGATGQLTTNRIALSQAITTDTYNDGVFCGYDRIVVYVYSRRQFYHIALPSGMVTDLGQLDDLYNFYPRSSENWACWGVVESTPAGLSVVYAYSDTAISRTHLPDGLTTVVQQFKSLGDMASFTISPSRQRWYFHHESASQWRSGSGETLGSLPVALQTFSASPPVLFAQPQSCYFASNTAVSGVQFSISDGGALPRVYQWYLDGNPVAGGTQATLLVTNYGQATGQYQVVVSNPFGAVTSAVAELVIGEAPLFTNHPASQIISAGSDLVLSGSASGTAPLWYEWLYNGGRTGLTNNMLVLSNALWAYRGNFQLVASNHFGVATSRVAVVQILTPPLITSQPGDVSTIPGMGARLEVQVDGNAPFSYRWYKDGQPLAGETRSVFNLDAVEAANVGTYAVVVTNAFGSVTSSPARIFFMAEMPDTFRVMALLTNHSGYVEHYPLAYYGAPIAVSDRYVFCSGYYYNNTARFALDDLAGGTQVSPDQSPYEGLVSDLRTETIYSFANGKTLISNGPYDSGQRMDTLVELDRTSLQPVGRYITLSCAITNNYYSLVCSGFNRVGYWDYNTSAYYDISLPSGTVTVHTNSNSTYLNLSRSYSWATWGLVEFFDGDLYMVYPSSYYSESSGSLPAIVRTRVRDGQTTSVGLFSNLGYLGGFTVSIPHRRWYLNHVNNSQFTGTNYVEAATTYADAQFIYVDRSNTAPAIARQPVGSVYAAGATANLEVMSWGSTPLHYQWWFNGEAIPDGTNAALAVTNLSPAVEGAYTVVVTNAYGAATSAPAMVYYDYGGVVAKTMLVFGVTNRWHYNQTGANLGNAWVAPDFDDTAWPEGRGILAYEDNNAYVIANTNTPLSLYGTNGARNITYYFRARFAVSNYVAQGARGFRLYSSNIVDDGCVFYLNGTEQGRVRMNPGTFTYQTQATSSAPEGAYTNVSFNAGDAVPNSSSNLLAVEVHQYGSSSSDIVFGMALYAEYYFPSNPPRFVVPLADVVAAPGQTAVFTANVTGLAPLAFQWRFNGQRLLGQTGSSLALTNVQALQAGDYSVVVSNLAGLITSRVARLSLLAPPQIAQSPLSQQLMPGATLSLTVIATGEELGYQWTKDAQILAWATNFFLTISNVTPGAAGHYQVAVTNIAGAVTSLPALVEIVGPRLLAPALSEGTLQLRFLAEPGTVYALDFSEDLAQWFSLQTLTNTTGTIDFTDAHILQRARGFYRLRLVPPALTPPQTTPAETVR